MSEVLRVYHGSKAGLDGRIRPVSDGSSDFGRGFYIEAERICQRMRREGESLPEILERLGAK